MPKTILITGSTDGIGFATAEQLAAQGDRLILHGRNPDKLRQAEHRIGSKYSDAVAGSFVCDLSRLADVEEFATAISDTAPDLDVVVNNAGVLRSSEPVTADGLDVRFAVNAIAPYLLTRRLLPDMPSAGRVINLSSAAQAPVDLEALAGRARLDEYSAYAQSKLALTMWSRHLADELGDSGPAVIAVNPGSLLATKMVKEAGGTVKQDISMGVDALNRAALSEEFASASGRYFDNDAGQFGSPHPDVLDGAKADAVVDAIERIIRTATAR